MKAPVNKIIPVSVVDGPGNRTAVFLQGCNIPVRTVITRKRRSYAQDAVSVWTDVRREHWP